MEKVAKTYIHYHGEIDGWLEVDVQHREPSLVLFDDLEGGMGEEGRFKREPIIKADLHFCMTETITTL